jgi:hypothetical protein
MQITKEFIVFKYQYVLTEFVVVGATAFEHNNWHSEEQTQKHISILCVGFHEQ